VNVSSAKCRPCATVRWYDRENRDAAYHSIPKWMQLHPNRSVAARALSDRRSS